MLPVRVLHAYDSSQPTMITFTQCLSAVILVPQVEDLLEFSQYTFEIAIHEALNLISTYEMV